MEIEVGKSYELKNGRTFKCEECRPDQVPYQYGGKVYRADGSFDRIAYYAANGIYNLYATSNYDFKS